MPFVATLIALLLLLPLPASAQTVLEKISRADSRDISQIFFSCTSAPRFTHKTTGKRVDISFTGTVPAKDLAVFGEDERIVKILQRSRAGNFELSFFLRYPPRKVSMSTSKDGRAVLELFLGNQHSRGTAELGDRLEELADVEADSPAYSNPLSTSPYRTDWKRFFASYEAPLAINVPFVFSLPPFPVIAMMPPRREKNLAVLPEEIVKSGNSRHFGALLPSLLELIESEQDTEKLKLLALTYGEALLRTGDFTGAFKQLYLLGEKYPKEQLGIFAKFLLYRLQAEHQDPYLAHYELRGLAPQITPTSPLAPYHRLLEIETALASHNASAARELLEKRDVGFPEDVQPLIALRQGDALGASGNAIQAFVSYQLQKNSGLLNQQPYSQNLYCSILYTHKRYRDAAACYSQLESQLAENEQLGLVSYRRAMAELHEKGKTEMGESFAQIAYAYPETEAGQRAALKQNDLQLLHNTLSLPTAWQRCRDIAEQAVHRDIAEEAQLKMAILHSLQEQPGEAIQQLMLFLREFQHGNLRSPALALLIQLLPGEIKGLVAKDQALEALVLAKQNRDLFEKGWLDISLFADIARSYQKIGIYREAQQVYRHLIDMAKKEDRQFYYLPLIQSALDQGEYTQAEEYASQFAFNYPSGRDSVAILRLRLQALQALEQYDKILTLLPQPLPDDREMRAIAARAYFQHNEYGQATEILATDASTPAELPDSTILILAESHFQQENMAAARTLFAQLSDNSSYQQQALYRLAEIAEQQGNRKEASALLGRIVQSEGDSPWRRYAQKALEFSKLTEKKTAGGG